ncbi:MAG TPA: hydroxysqualene dehydroxylase HpnE [Casimicrobiaceae bacterium]|nr:hydroxysqualene dehydroxylase HpnE [Casimicrobiaceae bacterium]
MAEAARARGNEPRVAVVGGGWSGCAAAVTLAAAGASVTLFEQARTLGGRARRVAFDGCALDNGQHLLIGAYERTLELVGLVHGADRTRALFTRLPLTLRPFGSGTSDEVALTAWRVPAPFHLLGAILSARGLDWADRRALIADFRRLARAGFRCPERQTVADCFARTPRRAFDALWAPLCLAALNTAPATASAQVFANVLRAALAGSALASDIIIPAIDLSACFPEPASRFVEERGGVVRTGATVRSVTAGEGAVALELATGEETFSAAIVAVGPHQLATTLGEEAARDSAWRAALAQVRGLAYESITTIYVAFPGRVPLDAPLLRLAGGPGQWVFDRSVALAGNRASGAASLLAVVISAGGPHDALDHPTLARDAETQLRRLAPGLGPAAWSRVVAEKRATYACTPALARPSHGRVAAGVYLAGDYTDAEYPATLEAAVRSGIAAARALLADRGTGLR